MKAWTVAIGMHIAGQGNMLSSYFLTAEDKAGAIGAGITAALRGQDEGVQMAVNGAVAFEVAPEIIREAAIEIGLDNIRLDS